VALLRGVTTHPIASKNKPKIHIYQFQIYVNDMNRVSTPQRKKIYIEPFHQTYNIFHMSALAKSGSEAAQWLGYQWPGTPIKCVMVEVLLDQKKSQTKHQFFIGVKKC